MLDLYFQTERRPPAPTVPDVAHAAAAPAPKKKKKKPPAVAKEPGPADVGVNLHATFTPLPREKNVPQAVEDPFANVFGGCAEEDAWDEGDVFVTEDVLIEDTDGDGLVDEEPVEDDDDEEEDDNDDESCGYGDTDSDLCMSSPVGSDEYNAFVSRWKKTRREPRAVYTGPQLLCDDEDDDGAF